MDKSLVQSKRVSNPVIFQKGWLNKVNLSVNYLTEEEVKHLIETCRFVSIFLLWIFLILGLGCSRQESNSSTQKETFPSNKLVLYVVDRYRLCMTYPINWIPAGHFKSKNEKIKPEKDFKDVFDNAVKDFYPTDLYNIMWISEEFSKDEAAMWISVQRSGGFRAEVPLDCLRSLANTMQEQLEHDGYSIIDPTIVETEKLENYHLVTLRSGQKAVITEGIHKDGTWQCVVLTPTDWGYVYELCFSVNKLYLKKYRDLFPLVLKNFFIGGVMSRSSYFDTYSALQDISTEKPANRIIFVCGYGSIFDIFSILPYGVGLRKVAGEGFGWVAKSKGTDFIYLGSPDGLFRVSSNMAKPELVLPIKGILSFDISPDGKRICYCTMDDWGTLWVSEVERFAPTKISLGLTPKWSPDGTLIAFRKDGKINLISPEGGVPISVKGAEGVAPDWLPDGSGIVFNAKGVIRQVDLLTEKVVDIVNAGVESTPRVSPNGRFIAYAATLKNSRDVYIWDRKQQISVLLFAHALNCDVMDW